jgi:hypothetical protein
VVSEAAPLRDGRARGSLTTDDSDVIARRDVVRTTTAFLSSVNAVVKLLRAYGGCLGAGRR